MSHDALRATGKKAVILMLIGVTGLWGVSCKNRKETGQKTPVSLELSAGDGLRIAATLYPVAQPDAPGLILVHGLGGRNEGWKPFAQRAQRAGYACIAFDLRGHGRSTNLGGQTLSYKSFTEGDWQRAARDISVVWDHLPEYGINPANSVLVGSDIGANLALVYAVDHSEVPAVVMVSPGLDYKGVKTESAIVALGQRPVLLISGKEDTYSATACETLKKVAMGFSEIRLYAGSAHGIDLLDFQAMVPEDIFLWLRPIIGQNLPVPE